MLSPSRVIPAIILVIVVYALLLDARLLGYTEPDIGVVEASREVQDAGDKQPPAGTTDTILFGDMHVHTTFSPDAFNWSLPINAGEGAHPPADACDYARFCSAIDFWGLTDHAEATTQYKWQASIDMMRACQAQSDPRAPDLISFLGWEWTQVGNEAATHYGHKNVHLKTLENPPGRVINSGGVATNTLRNTMGSVLSDRLPLADFLNAQRYHNILRFFDDMSELEPCPDGTDSSVSDCLESAITPTELYRKLNEWDVDTIVIPHGTTWGFYTPFRSDYSRQLRPEYTPPEGMVPTFEIYSGHGNSEEYRSFRAADVNEAGDLGCPTATDEYQATCDKAGEIAYDRCIESGLAEDACRITKRMTRALSANSNILGHLVVPDVSAADWLDSGQCRDCFQPALNYRPMGSFQWAMASTFFDDDGTKNRFKFGVIASSDNHRAAPGTGYKEVDLLRTTESTGVTTQLQIQQQRDILSLDEIDTSRPRLLDPGSVASIGFAALEGERQASFFLTGGLAAAHVSERSRDGVWDAFQNRSTYGTSGKRQLLWFDLVNSPSGERVPMGGEASMWIPPVFKVRALGSFKQLDGCPDYGVSPTQQARIEKLCLGECYNPSDERERITRIEVVRILPQASPGENRDKLIQDPYMVHQCPEGDTALGCEWEFSDPDYSVAGRDAVYYVRAIQEPSPHINGENLRCELDENGRCIKVKLCNPGAFGDPNDDCLSTSEPRAWSSPIFLEYSLN